MTVRKGSYRVGGQRVDKSRAHKTGQVEAQAIGVTAYWVAIPPQHRFLPHLHSAVLALRAGD